MEWGGEEHKVSQEAPSPAAGGSVRGGAALQPPSADPSAGGASPGSRWPLARLFLGAGPRLKDIAVRTAIPREACPSAGRAAPLVTRAGLGELRLDRPLAEGERSTGSTCHGGGNGIGGGGGGGVTPTRRSATSLPLRKGRGTGGGPDAPTSFQSSVSHAAPELLPAANQARLACLPGAPGRSSPMGDDWGATATAGECGAVVGRGRPARGEVVAGGSGPVKGDAPSAGRRGSGMVGGGERDRSGEVSGSRRGGGHKRPRAAGVPGGTASAE